MAGTSHRTRLLTRSGLPLSLTKETPFNVADQIPLAEVPFALKQAVLLAEDHRFFSHKGTDWIAVSHAVVQNLKARSVVRGASTITEQVVRMLHPRPRTFRSRILEAVEARLLETRVSKAEIFAFYLNQVPYPFRSRGVVQAARVLYNRDLSTLSPAEILTLAVLPRAPEALRPDRHPDRLLLRIHKLALRMETAGHLPENSAAHMTVPLVERPGLAVHAPFFVRYLRRTLPPSPGATSRTTTLDGHLQKTVSELLDARLRVLKEKRVVNGAVLVVEHATGEIRAWSVAGNGKDDREGGQIDAVTTLRQPGSTLKPFAYAMALESGWTAATPISDAPVTAAVGRGLHDYRNYSRVRYGTLPLREALANSLNLPAVRTVRHVGVKPFLDTLRKCGIPQLTRSADYYGDGLVLGNGELPLFALVSAYTVLANQGIRIPLTPVHRQHPLCPEKIFSAPAATLIANILSDAEARHREFGPLLDFPVTTAIKTGTSSDHKDAWAVGFDHQHTVGIWMGNLDRTPTAGLSGASGPGPLLRAIFAELNRHGSTRRLPTTDGLIPQDICLEKSAEGVCLRYRTEWFLPGTFSPDIFETASREIRLLRPTDGLEIAMDPRVPDTVEALRCEVDGVPFPARYRWMVDGTMAAQTRTPVFDWPLVPGEHRISVHILANARQSMTRSARIRVRPEPVAIKKSVDRYSSPQDPNPVSPNPE